MTLIENIEYALEKQAAEDGLLKTGGGVGIEDIRKWLIFYTEIYYKNPKIGYNSIRKALESVKYIDITENVDGFVGYTYNDGGKS